MIAIILRLNLLTPLASLYHEISLGFSHSPALRITWLDLLKKHHIQQNNFLEAGQVDMHVAALMIGEGKEEERKEKKKNESKS